MNRGVIYGGHDMCPNCYNVRALELYDKYDKPARFTLILDSNDISQFHMKPYYYFKCQRCGKRFKIDWCDDIPVPLSDSKLNKFISNFISSYEDHS